MFANKKIGIYIVPYCSQRLHPVLITEGKETTGNTPFANEIISLGISFLIVVIYSIELSLCRFI